MLIRMILQTLDPLENQSIDSQDVQQTLFPALVGLVYMTAAIQPVIVYQGFPWNGVEDRDLMQELLQVHFLASHHS